MTAERYAARFGYRIAEAALGPMTYRDFLAQHGTRGRWLLQRGHQFSIYRHGLTPYHSAMSRLRITRAYRLVKGEA